MRFLFYNVFPKNQVDSPINQRGSRRPLTRHEPCEPPLRATEVARKTVKFGLTSPHPLPWVPARHEPCEPPLRATEVARKTVKFGLTSPHPLPWVPARHEPCEPPAPTSRCPARRSSLHSHGRHEPARIYEGQESSVYPGSPCLPDQSIDPFVHDLPLEGFLNNGGEYGSLVNLHR